MPSSAEMKFQILKAKAVDIPILAEINRLAYRLETASMIAFPNWPDEKNMLDFFKDRIEGRFETPHTIVYKAVAENSNQIIGFISLTLEQATGETGAVGPSLPTDIVARKIPLGLNKEFVIACGAQVERLRELMPESKYYYISSFAVPPNYQRQGIGSKLLQHCLDKADLVCIPTWLISFPGSHNLYLRFGFEDVEHVEINLNHWDNYLYRGFGIYRNYAMVKEELSLPADFATTLSRSRI